MQDFRISVPGGDLAARLWKPTLPTSRGSKAPLLLMHDSLGCIEMWKSFPTQLSEHLNRPVIAYDRLGYGQSSARVSLPSPSFMEEEADVFLPAVLESFHLDSVILLGHSVGGAIALVAASRLGHRTPAVISISAPTYMEAATFCAVAQAKARAEKDNTISKLSKYHGNKADLVFASWTETWLSPQFASWSLHEVLPKVKSAVLTIQGDHDEFGTVKHSQLICDFAGGPCQQLIVQGGGHLPHRENPTGILNEISAFLSEGSL
ncbi:MAG TPA: alpha/beta hydrolase [Bdellovibrionales bacterium]|nr:MAG: hypothetical protein A2Z97_04645 [Bdellovibrionales bacterium GWB1_52_6]OFZ05545.1 MAG: hypothetical protein A2X97_11790 [Bdellovibrionales bacterium GWA1_52_35]HAR41102.1 alpha/beta hydrolase [Bdellovibrionales bacterium]HCM39085.1 alpha/beta hydrolase [Bdellovibrionales bacterium]